MENKSVRNWAGQMTAELKKVIVEQDELIEQSLISLICGGHVLIEGVPGLAKPLWLELWQNLGLKL